MGQQQLLLLVLSTVIVGLATVAGIQAFSENQAQASQDALVQKRTSIASDIQGLAGKPTQMGGIDPTSPPSDTKIANRLGYETEPVPAEGAGGDATCDIVTSGSVGTIDLVCSSGDAPQDVTIGVTPSNANDGNADNKVVTTQFGSSGSP
ncbi:hypothetical protein GGP91_000700 [Salinibacter ruber]|uniref:hypothetical protein n=1 Tax=Salinibacter ruber TaxID=146919 RepID=UPI0021681DA8|nr:hypothetical protein [Salinibacter ruber]MCS3828646.1 hypothetical protein [Salinibacter ruber]MCS4054935.1 hypothetical protein [Salinibacter ruber]MCS4058190.1 hypothetical protein [Salinibacter ruber]MCS4160280.1 hypothetical protein [Salinibacter ruber]